jgi:hypothetical protein
MSGDIGRKHSFERHKLWIEELKEGDKVLMLQGNGNLSKSEYTFVGEAIRPEGVPAYNFSTGRAIKGPWCELITPSGKRLVTTIWRVRPLSEKPST